MKEGEKERGKTREITSFLSILSDFQQIQVKFYQLFATVMRWGLENLRKKITKIIVRLTRERKKGRKKNLKKFWKIFQKNFWNFFFPKFQKRSKKVEKMILSPMEVVSEGGNRGKVAKKEK